MSASPTPDSGSPAPAPRGRRDVLVLGGGVIGLACALFLLRAGRSVVVLERARAGGGASHGNCGTITPSLLPLPSPASLANGLKWLFQADAPLRIKPAADPALLRWLLAFAGHCNRRDFAAAARIKGELLGASRARLAALVREERLDCEFAERGHLTVYRDARAFDRAARDVPLWRDIGAPAEVLDGAACRAREPALNDSIVGAFFHRGDAQLRPDRYAAELARAVRALGGEIRERAEVRDFRIERGRVVSVVTAQGEHAAAEVVFALGAWSPHFARRLGLKLPIQPGKGYSITYSRPTRAPSVPLVLKERSVCVTAWPSGYRLGSTMEFAGYDATLNRTRLDALARGAAEYLHEPVGARVEEEWYGWRPMTPDDLPIIGRAPQLSNLTLATGHGMLGVTLSAITGQLVAEVLSRRTPSLDLAPFSVMRFN